MYATVIVVSLLLSRIYLYFVCVSLLVAWIYCGCIRNIHAVLHYINHYIFYCTTLTSRDIQYLI